MNKLLSPRSRGLLSFFLAALTLEVMAAAITMVKYPAAATGLLLFATAALLALSLYVGHVHPTPGDLVEEAKRRLDADEMAAMEWATTEIRRLDYRQMTRGQKLLMVVLYLTGVVCILAGLADLAGLTVLNPLRYSGPDGVVQEIPRWTSGLLFLLFGVVAFLMTSIVRIQMMDRIDEAMKRLVREMTGKGIKPH